MKSRRVSTWLIGALLVAVLGTWTAIGFHHPADVQVASMPVSVGTIVRRIVASGTLQAVTTVQIGAQVSGTIQSLGADYNSIVRKGQVLARLDPALFQAALDEAQATLARTEAAEAQAQADKMGLETAVTDARMKLTRAEELSARELIPRADLDAARIAMDGATAAEQSAESQVGLARAAVSEAKAEVDQASVNLNHTVIESPIDGIIVARNVDVGQTVASAFQAPVLFNIAADLTHMQVEVDIDEADIGGVQPGEPAAFEVETYPHDRFEGNVSSIRLQPVAAPSMAGTGAPTATAPSTGASGIVVNYATMVDVVNPDEKLRPGMTATVTLTGSRRENVLRIPNNALTFRPPLEVLKAVKQTADAPPMPADTAGGPARRRVWRFDGAQFTPIDVRVGLADEQWSELVSGPLHQGETVVTSASLGVAGTR